MVDTSPRWFSAAAQQQPRGGPVFRELSVAEQRYQAVLSVIENGLQVTEAAAKAGVTRQALHEWLTRYAEGGLEGLVDRSHRPRSCPHPMDPAVEVRLTELRGLHPGWGADRLRYRLERQEPHRWDDGLLLIVGRALASYL